MFFTSFEVLSENQFLSFFKENEKYATTFEISKLLFLSIKYNNTKITKFLLEKKFNKNYKDFLTCDDSKDPVNLLFAAVYFNSNEEIIEKLILKECDIHFYSKTYDMNVLDVAIENNHTCVQLLISKGANSTF